MSNIIIEVKLFGSLRNYEKLINASVLKIEVSNAIKVTDLKQKICEILKSKDQNFNDQQLIFDSAIANNQKVLALDEELVSSCFLAILPPVCGG